MKFLIKMLWVMVVFAVGVIAGFMIAPVKMGFESTVNYNYKKPIKTDDSLEV